MYVYEILTNNGNGVTKESLLQFLGFVFALLTALVLHEIAHGLVALANGDNTAKLSGRLSLNPLRHFNWFGLLLMFLVGFGFANPVPVNPNNYKKRKLGEITVSLAGVITNLVLAFLFMLGFYLSVNSLYTLTVDTTKYYIVYFLLYLCMYEVSINLSFAAFNILPLYPLDGYRLIASFVNENNGFMKFLRKYSFYIIIVFVIWDSISLISAYCPLNIYMNFVVNGLYGLFSKFWGLFF